MKKQVGPLKLPNKKSVHLMEYWERRKESLEDRKKLLKLLEQPEFQELIAGQRMSIKELQQILEQDFIVKVLKKIRDERRLGQPVAWAFKKWELLDQLREVLKGVK